MNGLQQFNGLDVVDEVETRLPNKLSLSAEWTL